MKLGTLKDRAQREVNRYTRIKHSDINGTCECVTCNALFHYKDGDAGHYIAHHYQLYRYAEWNIFPQCKKCNRYQGGNQAEYTLFMLDRFGKTLVDKALRSKWTPFKHTRDQLDKIYTTYKTMADDLEKQKG